MIKLNYTKGLNIYISWVFAHLSSDALILRIEQIIYITKKPKTTDIG